MTIQAIYENGIFRPLERLDLPDRSRVEFDLRVLNDDQADRAAQQRIYELLGQSLASEETDVSQRHNGHQP